MIAARRLAPSGTWNNFRMPGTSTIIPTRPYTTEGIPASKLTADCIMLFTLGGASLARYTAVKKPTGTPSRIAPAVPYTLVRINGRMPNLGSAAVEAHTFPNKKFHSPISRIAGMPETTRYPLISSTHPTVISPSRKKITWTINSPVFFIVPSTEKDGRYCRRPSP